jgi:Glycosyl hydrolase family 99
VKIAAAIPAALAILVGGNATTHWTLAQARAYLADHQLALVDRTQSDRPEFDVTFSGQSARSLRVFGRAFRFEGRAHDVLRDTDLHVRFVLHTNGRVDEVHGPQPNRSQPSFPIRATFYYGWFPEAWNQDEIDPFTLYHPTLGFYDSGNPAVLRSQIAALRYAHVSTAISSWWGHGSRTDSRFPLALALARQTPVRWALYYEAEGYGDPSAAQIHGDLLYLKQRYFNQPAYLRVDGKPVVFAYGDGREDCSVAQRWHDANAGIGAYLVLSAFGAREHLSFEPFAPSNPGGVNVGAGDLTLDARPALIAAPGPGTPPLVKVFGADGTTIASFLGAEPGDLGGLSVAAADFFGNGREQVITDTESDGTLRVFSIRADGAVERASFAMGLPHASIAAGNVAGVRPAIVVAAANVVKVFDESGDLLSSFTPDTEGPVAVAVGDVVKGGRPEIVTAAHGLVRIFDARGAQVYPEFHPYGNYTGDVSVAVGDTNGDGYPDIVTDGDGVPVRIFSLLGPQATQFAEFGAFDPSVRGAVSLAAVDTNRNGSSEIVAGAPAGYGGEVRLVYGFRDCANQPNGWHVYNPSQPELYLPPYQFGISPGFARPLVRPGDPSLQRDLSRWDQSVADMNASPLPWHLVETFNEWGEGTAIESAQEWSTTSGYGAYLDALHSVP